MIVKHIFIFLKVSRENIKEGGGGKGGKVSRRPTTQLVSTNSMETNQHNEL